MKNTCIHVLVIFIRHSIKLFADEPARAMRNYGRSGWFWNEHFVIAQLHPGLVKLRSSYALLKEQCLYMPLTGKESKRSQTEVYILTW